MRQHLVAAARYIDRKPGRSKCSLMTEYTINIIEFIAEPNLSKEYKIGS